jgi:oligoribonuclease NrnB/cAMP/cGMP phosphodiesterase (DHH superfamily)
MKRVCFYHAGCPDGFGAAWAVWRRLGEECQYVPRGHEDGMPSASLRGAWVAFVDIAPSNAVMRELAEVASDLLVLDHHVTSRDRFAADPELVAAVERNQHRIHFDLSRCGSMLAWRHFHPDAEVPELIAYVEDQDLWRWALPKSREVNAAIGSYPRTFESWEELAARPADQLAAEGTSILRAQVAEIEQALENSHPAWLGDQRVEAVNAVQQRSQIGHELAARARFGVSCGLVYRITGSRVDCSIYSIGDFDVARIASSLGGGGHRNAAGFSVDLETWIARYT